MQLQMLQPSSFTAKATGTNRRRVVTHAAAVATEAKPVAAVPANVKEARAWIAAWRGNVPKAGVPSNVAEARAWISAWRSRQSAANVPANVAEARAWISNWRTSKPSAVEEKPSTPQNVAEARAWIAKWQQRSAIARAAARAQLSEEELKKAIEIQLKRSATVSSVGKSGSAAVAKEARKEANEIVQATRGSSEPEKVLRALRERLPLLSDNQVSEAIARQIRTSQAAAKSAAKPAASAKVEVQQQSAAKATTSNGPSNTSFAPCKVNEDGTLVFTQKNLEKAQYQDILTAINKL